MCLHLQLPDAPGMEDDDFIQVSYTRRLVNISGTVRDREEVKLSKHLYNQTSVNGRVYSKTTTTMVVAIGTK
jgi:HSP20 family molecular chaperone IbpA